MPLETALYIHQLNEAYPGAGDDRREGDDHLRLIKSAIKNTFPSVKGVVTKSHDQLNATPHDKSSLAQMLGAPPILVNELNRVVGGAGTGLTFALHVQSGRVRFAAENYAPVGGFVLDSEFTGGNQGRSASQGWQVFPGGLKLCWGSFTVVNGAQDSPTQFSVPFQTGFLQMLQVYATQANGNGAGFVNVSIEGFDVNHFMGFVNSHEIGTRTFRFLALGLAY